MAESVQVQEPRMRARMISIVAEILEMDPTTIRGDQRLREDLGMDSLGSLELLSTISEQLRLDIEMEDAMDIVTVDDAALFVELRQRQQESAPSSSVNGHAH